MSTTVLHRLAAWADSTPDAVAQRYKHQGEWKTITAREYCDRVYWLALFLEAEGMTPKDIGTILSYNCVEWVHINLAALLLGAKSAGIYPNSTQKDILYVLNHSQSRFLSVQNKDYFKKIAGDGKVSSLPSTVEKIIVFDGDTSISPKAISYEDALGQGKKLASAKGAKTLAAYLKKLDPQGAAFIIYTSGTTGDPKGAILSHDNLAYTADVVADQWKLPKENGSLFSFLPLCHIAETLQNIGVGITQHYTVSFCTKFENVATELPDAEPTLLLCVPRVWEKMMEGVNKKVNETQGIKKPLALWAFSVGQRTWKKRLVGQSVGLIDGIQLLVADKLILSKVRKALGLRRAEALASGAAPLSVRVIDWFGSLGLEMMEDFGQTESTGVVVMTERGVDPAGTVGRAPKGVDVKIADDGEILTRGRHVFLGYFKDEATTAETVKDGWLYTGDLGEFDSRGFVKIRGRKKEIMKSSGGKMVAPVPIEEALKADPAISQVCMVGDGRKFFSALITLSESKLAQLKDDGANGTLEPIITKGDVFREVQDQINLVNSKLASYEQIKKFAILSKEFSIIDGEMTPTLKMKRNFIEKKYEDVINRFYEAS